MLLRKDSKFYIPITTGQGLSGQFQSHLFMLAELVAQPSPLSGASFFKLSPFAFIPVNPQSLHCLQAKAKTPQANINSESK